MAAVCLSGTAEAARWRVGVFVGGPVWYGPGPYYYAPPPYYYPPPVVYGPPVVVQQEPDVYVERSQNESAAPGSSSGTWWYCAAAKKYYPYVKECPSGWQEVPATPPAPNR
ncbi:hypothetical protein C9I57_29580 [Trinickia symbiotica]|uniref:Uncharacterized protein n=2 Tax=Trinickia symbiotica TaxID=863227 RepID=A0A2T3XL25_9BURK|nr:hypothetical protein C9I57_29580 [Trinickia symbiotica]